MRKLTVSQHYGLDISGFIKPTVLDPSRLLMMFEDRYPEHRHNISIQGKTFRCYSQQYAAFWAFAKFVNFGKVISSALIPVVRSMVKSSGFDRWCNSAISGGYGFNRNSNSKFAYVGYEDDADESVIRSVFAMARNMAVDIGYYNNQTIIAYNDNHLSDEKIMLMLMQARGPIVTGRIPGIRHATPQELGAPDDVSEDMLLVRHNYWVSDNSELNIL